MRAVHDIGLARAIGQRFGVQAIIIGEGLGHITTRDGRLLISRARVEAKAINTADATIIGTGAEEGTARDLSGPIGAKAALRNAGGKLADELIGRMARPDNLCPHPRAIARVSTAVIKFTAPGLPSNIDFSTILSDEIVKLGTVDVIVAGQDLETVLSNGHAGTIRLPDVVLIGNVDRAEIVNIGVVPIPPAVFYLNRVTLNISVRAVKAEDGTVLTVVQREGMKQGLDIVISIAGTTFGIFDRTVLGQLTKDLLQEIAAKMTPEVIYALPPPTYFDVITVCNGDRFGGRILNPSFTIVTTFGQLTIPTANIQSIVVKDSGSRITRTDGSTFSGQILDAGLMVEGLGNIPMGQVATVVFVIK